MTDATVTISIYLPEGEMPNGISLANLQDQCPKGAHITLDLGGARLGCLPGVSHPPPTTEYSPDRATVGHDKNVFIRAYELIFKR